MMNSEAISRIRYALWEAYGHRCAYTKEYMEYAETVIDHIIPRNKAHLIQERIRKYGLDKDFTIDSPENLLPVKSYTNLSKGKRPFAETAELYYLQMAKKMKPKAEEELRKLEINLRKREQIILDIAVHEQAALLQHPPFSVKKKITITDVPWADNHYWNSTENIALHGHLPSIYNETGGCVIEFRQENIMMTLSADDIQEIAEKNMPAEKLFLRGCHPENGQPFVVIKNNALFPDEKMFTQLAGIFDDFLKHYNSLYNEFTDFIQAGEFTRKDGNYYILTETTRKNWKKLLECSQKYDMDTKRSPYTFHFNDNGSTILALDKESNDITFELIPDHAEVWHPGNSENRITTSRYCGASPPDWDAAG